MILAFDIGNTHIVPVFFDEYGNIIESFRIPTNLIMTEDTLFGILKSLTEYKNINLNLKSENLLIDITFFFFL